jgi:hypothetical protein
MKALSYLFTIFFLVQFNLNAQGWHPEVTLVSTGFDVSVPDIAVFENNVHVVWQDYRAGSKEQVYYKRSTDDGLNWNPGERLSIDPERSSIPAIAAMHNNVHVAWLDFRDHGGSDDEVYYKRSTNNGDWFEAAIRLTNVVSFKWDCDIAVFDDNIHIVWGDGRNVGSSDIYYIRSTDNGITWSPEILITNPSGIDQEPKVAISGTNVFIIWESFSGGIYEVYFRRSIDNGINWESEQKLNSSNTDAFSCQICSFDNNIHISWVDIRTGNPEVFYIRSTNLGDDWSAETRLTFNPAYEIGISIASFQEKVHLFWTDDRNIEYEVFYIKSIDNGVNWEAEELISSIPVESWSSRISVFGENVFAVWEDTPAGAPGEIIFRRYLTPTSVDNEIIFPQEFVIDQNYPNPFNPATNIKYQIPELSFVTIKVYDVLGNEMTTLVSSEKLVGSYEVTFDGTGLPSGIYFYRLQAGSFVETKKMVLMK